MVSFEDAWHGSLPPAEDLPRLLPDIERATEDDRQVAVYSPVALRGRDALKDPPASLDGLAAKPWVESVVLGWDARASVLLPGVRSLIGLHMTGNCDQATLANLPKLEQLVLQDALPESVAGLPRLRDAIFDWSTFDVPRGVDVLRLLDHPEEREPYRRPTAGEPALAGLKSVERLRIRNLHYRDDVAPIAELDNLRWLSLQGWRNLRALSRLNNLERLELLELEMTNLKPFRSLVGLRSLRLMGRMKSIEGIEALESLEDLFLRGRLARDLSPLAQLPRLGELELIYPDAVEDFRPIGRIRGLRRLELLLGDNTDSGPLPSIDFLAGLEQLEELELLNIQLLDNRLDVLFELPRLRFLRLTGRAGPDVDELRRRRPDLEIETHLIGEPEGRVHVGPVHYDPPFAGVDRWSIFQSLADLLGTETNSQADQRIRAELGRGDPQLLKRLVFDSEAGAVGIYADSEADIRAVAEIIRDLSGTA